MQQTAGIIKTAVTVIRNNFLAEAARCREFFALRSASGELRKNKERHMQMAKRQKVTTVLLSANATETWKCRRSLEERVYSARKQTESRREEESRANETTRNDEWIGGRTWWEGSVEREVFPVFTVFVWFLQSRSSSWNIRNQSFPCKHFTLRLVMLIILSLLRKHGGEFKEKTFALVTYRLPFKHFKDIKNTLR